MRTNETSVPRSRGLIRENASLLVSGLRLFDVLLVGFAGWLAHWWYLGESDLSGTYELALLIGMLLSTLMLSRFGSYRAWRGGSLLDELGRITLAWMMVGVVLVLLAFLTKMGATYSRVWGVTWGGLSWVLLISSRVILRTVINWARARGLNSRSVVVVGAHGLGTTVVEQILKAPWAGLRVVGMFGECERVMSERGVELPVFGGVQGVQDFVNREKVDQVWLALPLSEEEQILSLVEDLRNTMVDIRLVPELSALRLLDRSISDVAGLPVVELSVTPMNGSNRVVKAMEDRVLALLILLLISPLMLAIAVAVKWTSPGPVFFKQQRHGWDGAEFEMYKFRSMLVHDEGGHKVTQACRDDPRVTRVGAFLRRMSLDELPQFINVLLGSMSIVGPRPHAVAHNDHYRGLIDDYMRRHKVKPGITGWAQVNGYRGETDTLEKMQKRVEYDLYYIEHWSLWFDLRIILMTVFKGFVNPNAY